MFITSLYMFRATPCPSSGELVVSIQFLVYVTLCRWPSSMQVGQELKYYSVCFIFLYKSVRNKSDSKKWGRYDKKMYTGIHTQYPLFRSDFNETWIFSVGFRKKKKKHSNIEFHKNPSSRSRVVSRGQTDGQSETDRREEVNSRFSQFCERAYRQDFFA
jgi:hypothetical protein